MSKLVLIMVENNEITEPDIYDTYEQAYKTMEHRFNKLKEVDDEANIHENYASIQSDYDNYDWRICEVKY